MIEFFSECNVKKYINKIDKMNYCQLLKIECYFCIKIDNKIFFEEPLFPILEFLYFYKKWDKASNFEYITIESEDNPIISFIKKYNGWYIDSVWKKFECNYIFELEQIINAIEKLI